MSKPWDRMNRHRWAKVRAKRLELHPYCTLALPDCTSIATEVDHIIPLSRGGPRYDIWNTRSVCTNCHRRRTHPTTTSTPTHPEHW